MSTFKRSALIAVVACSTAATVLFALILWHPGGAALAEALRDIPVLLGLASLVALLALAGAIGGIVRVVQTFTHVAARLNESESGSISIEKSALVSVATGALARIPNVSVQSVTVDVVPKRGSAVLDVDVLASPLGTDSLMALAEKIQTSAKRALEAFTEHEVRYVSVKFVESRRRAAAAVDAASAGDPVPAEPEPAPAPASESEPAPSPDPAEPARPEEAKPSLWSRAKARAGRLRARVDAEEPVMTQAVVTDAAEEPTAGAAPAEEPAPASGQPVVGDDAQPAPEGEPDGAVEPDEAAGQRRGDTQER